MFVLVNYFHYFQYVMFMLQTDDSSWEIVVIKVDCVRDLRVNGRNFYSKITICFHFQKLTRNNSFNCEVFA